MSYTPKNPNGQAAMAASSPVVIASDQTAIPVSVATVPSHAVTNAGTFQVQIQDGTGSSLVSSTNDPSTAARGLITRSRVIGNVDHDGVDAGSPIKIGGKASSSAPTDVSATGDRVDAYFDMKGRQVVLVDTALPAGSAVVGKVGIDQTTPGTTNLVALAANQSVNVAQVAGTAPVLLTDNADGVAASATVNKQAVISRNSMWFNNNGTWERIRQIEHGTNTTGLGIQAVAFTAEFDDVSPTAITENQFGNARMSANRNLYSTIRDAAGNERGLNVDANGEIGIGAIRTSITPGTAAANLGKAEDAVHASGDVGVMNLAVANEALSSISGTDGDYTPHGVDRKGRLFVVQKANTSTLTNVASSATSVTLLASNSARISATIYNDSTQVCYVKFGATASATSFTVPLATNTYYEVPGGYTGIIDGIWVSANGNARVTELT